MFYHIFLGAPVPTKRQTWEVERNSLSSFPRVDCFSYNFRSSPLGLLDYDRVSYVVALQHPFQLDVARAVLLIDIYIKPMPTTLD